MTTARHVPMYRLLEASDVLWSILYILFPDDISSITALAAASRDLGPVVWEFLNSHTSITIRKDCAPRQLRRFARVARGLTKLVDLRVGTSGSLTMPPLRAFSAKAVTAAAEAAVAAAASADGPAAALRRVSIIRERKEITHVCGYGSI